MNWALGFRWLWKHDIKIGPIWMTRIFVPRRFWSSRANGRGCRTIAFQQMWHYALGKWTQLYTASTRVTMLAYWYETVVEYGWRLGIQYTKIASRFTESEQSMKNVLYLWHGLLSWLLRRRDIKMKNRWINGFLKSYIAMPRIRLHVQLFAVFREMHYAAWPHPKCATIRE